MTSELTGLKLRRAACEALGWTQIQYCRHPHELIGLHYGESGTPCVGALKHTPKIESDPAVSEMLFLEWCEKNGFDFAMQMCLANGVVSVKVYKCGNTGDANRSVWIVGSTPSEARALAIVAADRKEKS